MNKVKTDMSSTLPLTEPKKQAREPKRQYEKRVRESTFHVGPISTRLFSKPHSDRIDRNLQE